MTSTVNKMMLLTCFLLVCFFSVTASAWDEETNSNFLIFDKNGTFISGYHLPYWTIKSSGTSPLTVTTLTWKRPDANTIAVDSETKKAINVDNSNYGVPNLSSGISLPSGELPDADIPTASFYSFDAATGNNSGTPQKPVITASKTPGTYDHTLTIEFNVYSDAATPPTNLTVNGEKYFLPAIVHISETSDLTVSATDKYGTSTKTFSYTINQSYWVDSDKDGYPDAWEIKYGFNPFKQDMDRDSDKDGVSDLDELLRGYNPALPDQENPLDTDGDGFPDADELLRGYDHKDPLDHPRVSSLYEVECRSFSGTLFNTEGPMSKKALIIETLSGEKLASATTDQEGHFTVTALPRGKDAVIRSAYKRTPLSEYLDNVAKRYVPAISAPHPSDMTYKGPEDPDAWFAAWKEYLGATLEITVSGFDVTSTHLAETALLEHALEIAAGNGNEDAFISLGKFGHRPSPGDVASFASLLATNTLLPWTPKEQIQTPRRIADFMSDISRLVANPCVDLASDVVALYQNISMDIEKEISMLVQNGAGKYHAGLILKYAYDNLDNDSFELCSILDEKEDLDNDGLLNEAEVSAVEYPTGRSDLFMTDTDADGLEDGNDNCPGRYNPDQKDSDADGVGDVCDPDADDDGLENSLETAFGTSPYIRDTDGNGFSDYDEWRNPETIISQTPIATPTNINTHTLTGARVQGTTVEVKISDPYAYMNAVTYPDDHSWACEIQWISDGENTITVTGTLNTVTQIIRTDLFIDSMPPHFYIFNPWWGETMDHTPLVTIDLMMVEPEDIITVYLNGVKTDYASGDHMGPLYAGNYTLKVTGEDAVGNSYTEEVQFSIPAGDIVKDEKLDLKDIIAGLQVLTDSVPGAVEINQYAAGTNGKISMADILSVFESIRNPSQYYY